MLILRPKKMKHVLILYKFLPQYRLEFFEQLKIALNKEGIELDLIYGKLKNTDSLKKDEVDISWARYIPNRSFRIGQTELIWQPCLKHLKGKDLVIVEQANKLLLNYYLMFARLVSRYRFANWGHGRNMQDDPNSTRNKFKYGYIKLCDWWFAYTTGVKEFLISQGYPGEKITVVQNAIETVNLRQHYASIAEEELQQLKTELGIQGSKVAIYCGGMYKEKRLDFMLEVCYRVKKQVPDFHMIFIGSGVDSYKAADAASSHEWIHYVGPKFGPDRVKYFKIASIQLMPGLVGLGILDSFALETPIFTTEFPFHSPEIEYLQNNVNGVMTRDDLDEYSETIINVMKSEKYLDLIEGCRTSAKIYTVENMVGNFKNGIISCLNS
jgi:L-malate glycosyltransferase